jgi:hypothetical protein
MGKKSGTAGKAVPPAIPDKSDDADIADPGILILHVYSQQTRETKIA